MRIYYNLSCIYFSEAPKELLASEYIPASAQVIDGLDPDWVSNYLPAFLESENEHIIFHCQPKEGIRFMKKYFKLIIAAGGVVWNKKHELLMIYRLGKWDLPKGKIERNEALAEGAIREVAEETGLENIKLGAHLKTSYHIYFFKGEWVLKQTEWFEMQADKQVLIPQHEEDITKAVWVTKQDVPNRLTNSYPNIVFLFQSLM